MKDLFAKFGAIRDIDIKVPRGPAGGTTFAFIEYEDDRDAEDAVRDRDGYKFDGQRLRVELARGGRRGGPDDRGRTGGGGGGGGGGGASGGGHGPPQRTDFKVIVENLPPNTSWQDLKDHMRKAGDVGFAEMTRDGFGVVEYACEEDMKYALRKLDDSEFVSTFTRGKSYIRVREDRKRGRSSDRDRDAGRGGSGGGDKDRRPRSPSRSASRSPRGRKASRSASASPAARKTSRSPRKASRSPSPRRRSPSPEKAE